MPFLYEFRRSVFLIALCGPSALAGLAQGTPANAAPVQTGYAFCASMNPTTQMLYFSDTFSYPAASWNTLPQAFFQAVKARDAGAANVNCTPGGSLQVATQTKQITEAQVKTLSQSMTAQNGKAVQIVETGWRYTGATGAVTSTAGTGLSSVGNSVTASGKDIGANLQNSMNQTVQGVEGTAVNTVTDSVNSMSTAAASSIQTGMQNLQTKMFHHAKPVPASAAPAQTAVAATAGTSVSAGPAAIVTPATLVTTSATTPAPAATTVAAAKPTIQDEGDGKHFILMLPGQPDAHELTLAPGSKNIYLEDATGDKYIVMPSGDITHIPHKNVAK